MFIQGFLHIDEYPPDANQGFDIPSAVITFPNFHVNMQFDRQSSVSDSPLLSGFQVTTNFVLFLLSFPRKDGGFSFSHCFIDLLPIL